MEKILLDTDMGSDIDDAVALAYLLCHPECDLLGITTVSSNPVGRAMMVDAICRAKGKQIPIHPGMDDPLCIDQLKKTARLLKYLDRWPHRTSFDDMHAIDFLNQTIRKHPGEITLLAIGPLTNIGMLFKMYPDTPSLLKGLVLMGGKFSEEDGSYPPNSEWNLLCDPHAAGIVYKAHTPVHRSVGLDITAKVFMDKEGYKKNFTSDILKVVADFSEQWFAEKELSRFHDPLAVATVFNKDLCTFKRGDVRVDYKTDNTCITYFEPNADGYHEVADSVDVQAFFDEFFRITQA